MLTELLLLLQLAPHFLQVNLDLLVVLYSVLEFNFFFKLLIIEYFVLLQEYGAIALYHLLEHNTKFYAIGAHRINDINE